MSRRSFSQMYWHALPTGWEQLDYDEFLEKRRKRIARVVHEGFQQLWNKKDESLAEDVSVQDLISAGELHLVFADLFFYGGIAITLRGKRKKGR